MSLSLGFRIKIIYAFLICNRATCPVHLIVTEGDTKNVTKFIMKRLIYIYVLKDIKHSETQILLLWLQC
jgi:hypothetical protein